ncbi:hypothetical protein BHYA_0203g00210 [Botrytis hyacinthi]|uniref:alpha-1,2-Mannosidase n=1 Tax=Botrytis hyacinthi TaxID=278943 RepID=A0A4Z1GBH4_9HELO|nr:hypothetical protein BHYA_0203g00210 [Botrytis hyacinthi]
MLTDFAVRRKDRIIFIAIFALIAFLLYHHAQQPSTPKGPTTYRAPLTFKSAKFDWSHAKQYFPVDSFTPLPKENPKKLPLVQHQFSKAYTDDAITKKRREAVREAFIRSWKSYKSHAWLHDELLPVSGGFKDPFGGWAANLVDCLDTLWIMDLKEEFYEAAAVAVQLDWSNTTESGINLFETTIRHLGGLLGAYDLSKEPTLLEKAVELGNMLYMAFDTPNRTPGFWLTFEDVKAGRQLAGTHDPSSGPTSLSLEFTRLSQLTGDDKYYDAIERMRQFLERTQEQSLLPGMWPTMVNFREGTVRGDNSFSLGALADSLYEYLPKMVILLSGRKGSASYEKMYRRAMDVVIEHVLFRPMLPGKEDFLFAGTTFVHEDGIHLVPEMQHLTCFIGGMFALGGKIFGIDDHIVIGDRIARGCGWVYQSFPTGVMPEIYALIECPTLEQCNWDNEKWKREGDQSLTHGFRHARDPRYLLRPEAIESIFIMYRLQGKEDLRETAWNMFEGIMRSTQTPLANSAISNVTVSGETEKEDSMESFWMAETLKYFYLIFSSPDTISLDEYVFTTEAHPFRRAD